MNCEKLLEYCECKEMLKSLQVANTIDEERLTASSPEMREVHKMHLANTNSNDCKKHKFKYKGQYRGVVEWYQCPNCLKHAVKPLHDVGGIEYIG